MWMEKRKGKNDRRHRQLICTCSCLGERFKYGERNCQHVVVKVRLLLVLKDGLYLVENCILKKDRSWPRFTIQKISYHNSFFLPRNGWKYFWRRQWLCFYDLDIPSFSEFMCYSQAIVSTVWQETYHEFRHNI